MGIISTLKQMIAGTLASSADVNNNFEELRVASNTNTTNIANLASCFFRQPTTSYKKNDIVYIPNSALCLVCTTSGTTSSDDINYTNISNKASVVDGTVIWLAGYRAEIVGSALTAGSALPLGILIPATMVVDDSDNSYRLANGQSIRQIDFPDFYNLIVKLDDEKKVGVCSEAEYQTSIALYGQCGMYVINRTDKTIKLPTITRFVAGLTNLTEIGTTLQDQIVNMTGYVWSNTSANCSGVFAQASSGEQGGGNANSMTAGYQSFDASRQVNTGSEVQPRHSKYPYYIVVSQTSRKGLDGRDGVDGFSPTIKVYKSGDNYLDLYITDIDGSRYTGNLKSHTPMRGVDYFTQQDIDDCIQMVEENVSVECPFLTMEDIVETSGNVNIFLDRKTTLYMIKPTSSVNITFVPDQLTYFMEQKGYNVACREILISMPETAYEINFVNAQLADENIDMSKAGNYLFAFRSFDMCQTWRGNLEDTW